MIPVRTEIIFVNAHCHRNMLDEACVQVAIYDDRLEVTSPGGLYNGLTYEQMLSGRSKLRNKAVANVFNQMGLIDAWGTGVKRIRDAAAEYGLPEPEFLEMDDTFRINLYRYSDDANGANHDANDANHDANDANHDANDANRDANDAKQKDQGIRTKILTILSANSKITQYELASKLGISRATTQRIMKAMTDKHLIVSQPKVKKN